MSISCSRKKKKALEKFGIGMGAVSNYAGICDIHKELEQKIKFEEESKLQIIEKYSFEDTLINSFIIPSSVTEIGCGVFSFCINLQIIEIKNPYLKSKDWNNICQNSNPIIIISNE